jgi:hypothetical protein
LFPQHIPRKGVYSSTSVSRLDSLALPSNIHQWGIHTDRNLNTECCIRNSGVRGFAICNYVGPDNRASESKTGQHKAVWTNGAFAFHVVLLPSLAPFSVLPKANLRAEPKANLRFDSRIHALASTRRTSCVSGKLW